MDPLLATDRSMGRLAKWLRLLGYDTLFDSHMENRDFLSLAGQGRILITRTRSLFGRLEPKRMVAVTSGDPREQLAEVVRRLDLKMDKGKAFGRCIRCNCPVEPINREQAAGVVPDYVFVTQIDFSHCPQCGRIYWKGSHPDRGLAMLKKMF